MRASAQEYEDDKITQSALNVLFARHAFRSSFFLWPCRLSERYGGPQIRFEVPSRVAESRKGTIVRNRPAVGKH
jgi:hypothetical protein